MTSGSTPLALRYLDGIATVEEEESLLAEIQSDVASRRTFVTLCRQMGMLHEAFSTERAETDVEAADSLPAFTIPTAEIFPTVCPTPDSLSASRMPLGTTLFSYAVSALFLCAAMLGAWAYKISLPENNHFVEQSSPTGQSYPKYVGRVTGMKDCVWSDEETSTILGAYVPFDRKYALSSGPVGDRIFERRENNPRRAMRVQGRFRRRRVSCGGQADGESGEKSG